MQNLGIYVSPLMLAEEKQMQQGQSSVISRTWQCEVHEDCMDIMHCIQQSLHLFDWIVLQVTLEVAGIGYSHHIPSGHRCIFPPFVP